jgi:predicted membrane protein (TIGR00267 family)
VFGVSDGLVSNTSLVMGFAGSGTSRTVILLAGVAGLLAGSFSMAAGEYISMVSQREMYEREISLEQAELEEKPDEERNELVLIYRAKGLDRADAEHLADRIMADRTFAAGAFVVVIPYLVGGGIAAVLWAIGLAIAALFGVGASIGVMNGRPVLRSGLRQVFVGALAGAVTYGVGHLIGASVS